MRMAERHHVCPLDNLHRLAIALGGTRQVE